MSITDMIFLLILAGFAFAGFWFGFIHMLGSGVGIVMAAFLSGRYFEFFADKLSFLFGGHDNWGRIIVFIILFLIITRLVGLIFWLINQVFNIISIIPFLKTINRLGGAIIASIEGIVLCSLVLYLAVRYPLGDTITQALLSSQVANWLLDVGNVVAPLLPEAVRAVQSVFSI